MSGYYSGYVNYVSDQAASTTYPDTAKVVLLRGILMMLGDIGNELHELNGKVEMPNEDD